MLERLQSPFVEVSPTVDADQVWVPTTATFPIISIDPGPFELTIANTNHEKPYGKNARRRARGGHHD
jgi:hypothetical protein